MTQIAAIVSGRDVLRSETHAVFRGLTRLQPVIDSRGSCKQPKSELGQPLTRTGTGTGPRLPCFVKPTCMAWFHQLVELKLDLANSCKISSFSTKPIILQDGAEEDLSSDSTRIWSACCSRSTQRAEANSPVFGAAILPWIMAHAFLRLGKDHACRTPSIRIAAVMTSSTDHVLP